MRVCNYSDASILEKRYQSNLHALSLLLAAKTVESQALSLYKNSPLSLSQLQKIQSLWENAVHKTAITTDNTPDNSELLSQLKNYHLHYQQKLKAINHKISLEESAKESFNAAKLAAKTAQDRQESAQSLADLTLVQKTWQTAIKRLQEIPPSTTLYVTSRSFLKNYLSNSVRAEKRRKQEEIAVNIYEKAISSAKVADKLEADNQWSQAVSQWNTALNYIRQVPNNTFISHQAQPLISTYSVSLKQAKKQLKQAVQVQNIESELKAMCLTPQKICQYSITEQLIKVQLDSHYLEKLWNTALQAKAQANLQIQVDLLNHLSTFEHRLQAISNQTGKSIEVYNAQGNLMTVYQGRQ